MSDRRLGHSAGCVIVACILGLVASVSVADDGTGRGDANGPREDARAARRYITDLPAESPEAAVARHKRVAKRRQSLVIMLHRGATKHAPENTLEACKAAMDRGADGVEIDIRKSADGVLYLFHDDTVDRMLAGDGNVKARTYAQLVALPFRNPHGLADENTRVPTFVSLLALARQRAMLLHLDIKDPGCEDRIIELLDAAEMWDHVVTVNNYNADRIRSHKKLKMLDYKGWFPQPDPPADAEQVKKFLDRPGEMVFLKGEPDVAVKALGRKVHKPVALPKGLRGK